MADCLALPTLLIPQRSTRRGGRVVYGSSLENWRGFIPTVGSNPTLSARTKSVRRGITYCEATNGKPKAIPASPPNFAGEVCSPKLAERRMGHLSDSKQSHSPVGLPRNIRNGLQFLPQGCPHPCQKIFIHHLQPFGRIQFLPPRQNIRGHIPLALLRADSSQ